MELTEHYIADEAAMLAFGSQLAQWLKASSGERGPIVYLQGDLGAGKTTLVRGILRSIGYQGSVKSPTYTLLEPYEDEGILHFDFYRIVDSEELEFIGIDELMDSASIKLIEWPQMAEDRLPPPDWCVRIDVDEISAGARRVTCEHHA
jgi:tRNA threonylcarbamoyladenosine biosynthesis protein TsaE